MQFLAQNDTTIDIGQGTVGRLGELTIPKLIAAGIRLLVVAAAVIFLFWLILGGIKWIMSSGDKAQTEAAREQITAALIGLVIVFSAWAIAQLIKALFGVDLFNLQLVPPTLQP